MPNHVSHIVTVYANGALGELAKFRAECFTEHTVAEGAREDWTHLDFQKVIPMPAVLEGIEASSKAEEAQALVLIAAKGPVFFGDETPGLHPNQIENIRDDVGMPGRHRFDKVAKAYLAKHPDVKALGEKRLQAIAETGHTDWYGWNTENWGTKWNSYSFSFEEDWVPGATEMSFKFDTAWSPPVPIFENLAARYPNLSFEVVCYDEGSCFAGKGWFNPKKPEDEPFTTGEATDELYEEVYGHPPEREEEEDA